MKKYLLLLAILFSGVVLISCSDDDNDDNTPQPPAVENDYLVEYELLKTITTNEVTAAFNSYESLQTMLGSVNTNSTLYKITYKTSFKGEEVNASALVAIPTGSASYPIVSFQSGSNTKHSEAPTANPTNPMYASLMYMSTTGFVVAIPDYIGFGASSHITPHPYFYKEATTRAVTDMLKAIKELPNNIEIAGSISNDLFLGGYSLGAWGTLATHNELQASNDFNLQASVCGGGIYNLVAGTLKTKALNQYDNPYFMAYLAKSFNALGFFPNPLTDFFQEPYASRIDDLFDGSNSASQINEQLTTTVSELLNPDFISATASTPAYAQCFASLLNNSVLAFESTVPIRFYHGTADTSIPAQSSSIMATAMRQAGTDPANAEYIALDGLSHTDAILPSVVATFNWFISLR